MPASCPVLKQKMVELHSLKEQFNVAFEEGTKNKDFSQAQKLKVELEKMVKEIEAEFSISIEHAEKIFGKERIIGPEDINKALGFSPKIEEIPFTEEEMRQHEKLGDILVYEATTTPEGRPLTVDAMSKILKTNLIKSGEYLLYKDQFNDDGGVKMDNAWFAKDDKVMKTVPDGGWKFVSPEVISGSEDKDYVGQIDFMIDYFKTTVFKGNVPEEYKEVFKQWDKDKDTIKNNAEELANHPISKLLGESFASSVYRLIVLRQAKGKKILENMYTRSNTLSSGGNLVRFGSADSEGARVYGGEPDYSHSSLGLVSSVRSSLNKKL